MRLLRGVSDMLAGSRADGSGKHSWRCSVKKLLVCCAMFAMLLSMAGGAFSAPQGTVKTRVVVVQRKVVQKAHRRHRRRHHTKRVAHHKTKIVLKIAR